MVIFWSSKGVKSGTTVATSAAFLIFRVDCQTSPASDCCLLPNKLENLGTFNGLTSVRPLKPFFVLLLVPFISDHSFSKRDGGCGRFRGYCATPTPPTLTAFPPFGPLFRPMRVCLKLQQQLFVFADEASSSSLHLL